MSRTLHFIKKSLRRKNFRLNLKSIFCFCIFLCSLGLNLVNAFVKDLGSDDIIDYGKYGYFENLGKENYKYVLLDRRGLGELQGEGIYPNVWSIYSNPNFVKARREDLLSGHRWTFLNTDLKLAYYEWVISDFEKPGLKQFFIAEIFFRAGYLKQALKAYYSVLVFFPTTIDKAYFGRLWYVAETALDRIYFLLDRHKELKWKLVDASLDIKNKFDNEKDNKIFFVNPGKFVFIDEKNATEILHETLVETYKFGNICLKKFTNANWQMTIDGKPFEVKGVFYSPILKGHDKQDLLRNKQDFQDNPDEIFRKSVGFDSPIMKKMGVNLIRLPIYFQDIKTLNFLFNKFGIRVLIDLDLDVFFEKIDFNNKVLLSKESFYKFNKLVDTYKNENFFFAFNIKSDSVAALSGKQIKNFYSFIDDLSANLKKLDPNHPIILSNQDLRNLDLVAEFCKNVDILGIESYKGTYGFGFSFWNDLKKYWQKPVIITEYGCPSFHSAKSREQAEYLQMIYHQNCWEDIKNNEFPKGVGLALGGIAYEWNDEWWGEGRPYVQDRVGAYNGPFLDGWIYKEFMGICAQSEDVKITNSRVEKKVYSYYAKVWNND